MKSYSEALKAKLKPWVKAQTLHWRMGMSLPHVGRHWAQAWAAHKFNGAVKPCRLLVVGDGRSYTSDQQFAPMKRHIEALRRELGHILRFRLMDDVLKDKDEDFRGYDAVIFKFSFETEPAQAQRIAAHFRKRANARSIPLIYFDGDDDQCIQFDSVLKAVDVYVKKHAFADRSAYTRAYVGRSNLTDYAARQFGFDFSGDRVPEAIGLPAQEVAKIRVGWNIALDDKIVELAGRLAAQPQSVERDIDVMCRASSSKDGTLLYAMRHPATHAIEALAGHFKVLAPTRQVGQAEYYKEMLRSKMCLSPFGYGELCWRDFEAALCGCLLLKPSMEHVETVPDIFQPHETYVPLAWDYSDLHEKVAYYLARPQQLERIAAAARRTLQEALGKDWFIARYRSVVCAALPLQQAAA